MTRARENQVKFEKHKAEGRNGIRQHAMKMRINSRSVQCPTDARYSRGSDAYIKEGCSTSTKAVELLKWSRSRGFCSKNKRKSNCKQKCLAGKVREHGRARPRG
jgi:hypothetical protein